MNRKKTIIVSGLALFAMFVGAGNLIFPPQLGAQAGAAVLPATIGFLITGVGLVYMGVIATTKAGGDIMSLGRHLGEIPIALFSVVVMLAIGPGLAIPRTAATTYEFLKGGLLPSLPAWVSSAIFFAIVLFFVYKPSKLIDRIGTILTPALLTVLSIIIIKGIVTPLGEIVPTGMESVFSHAFEGGYQTMDAIGSMCFTSIVVGGFVAKGIKDYNSVVHCTVWSASIAAIGIAMLYSGLLYIGATTSSVPGIQDLGFVQRLIFIAEGLLGKTGSICMSLAMALACLTTAIGLTSTVGEFFETLSKGKVRSVWVILASTAFSFYFSISGVETIVSIAVPVLSGIYPLAIVLIILNFFQKWFNHKALHIGCAIGALFPTLDMILGLIFPNFGLLMPLKNFLPASLRSFAWIVPVVVIGALLQMVLPPIWPEKFGKQAEVSGKA